MTQQYEMFERGVFTTKSTINTLMPNLHSSILLVLICFTLLITSSVILSKQSPVQVMPFSAGCRLQIVMAGNYNKYNYQNVPTWLDKSSKHCQFEFIRQDHPMMQHLTLDEKVAFEKMAPIPVIQADYMKFLTMYYLGGLVFDFDVAPLKQYPQDWSTGALSGCDVSLGVEHGCFEGDCLEKGQYADYGQLQTWALDAQKPRSEFLRFYLDKVVNQSFDNLNNVQDIAGSGMLSKAVREWIGGDYLTIKSNLKESQDQVARFTKNDETLCIMGLGYTGTECNNHGKDCLTQHKFEGTWKHGL